MQFSPHFGKGFTGNAIVCMQDLPLISRKLKITNFDEGILATRMALKTVGKSGP